MALDDSFQSLGTRVLPSSKDLPQQLLEEEADRGDIDGLDDPKNRIGQGAFGEVRKVFWRRTPAAAKIAHSSIPEEQKVLLLRELQLMVRCRHPNIVQFLGYIDSPFVILLEFLPKGNLRSYWRSHRLSVGSKTSICIDVLRALAYLHNRKPQAIVHRDVKPTNVLMTNSGIAKLTDFGLSRAFGSTSCHGGVAFRPSTGDAPPRPSRGSAPSRKLRLSKESWTTTAAARRLQPEMTTTVGTGVYMAPEATSSLYDEKVDIFSAGVTFYELFEQATFSEDLPFAFALCPGKIAPLLKQMGSIDPTQRPTAIELIDAFLQTKLARPPVTGWHDLADGAATSSACSVS